MIPRGIKSAVTYGVLPLMFFLLLLSSVEAVIRLNLAQNLITGGAGNFTNLTVNNNFLIGSGSFVGNITSDGSNFIFNIPNGSLKVNANMTLGDAEGTIGIYFYDAGSPTGELFKWDDGGGYFQATDDFRADGIIRSESDIWTSGSGDDLWLGSTSQGSSSFQAYANGNLVMAGDLRIGGFFIGLSNITAHTQSTTTATVWTVPQNMSLYGPSSGKWAFECDVRASTAAATTGYQFAINVSETSAGWIAATWVNTSGVANYGLSGYCQNTTIAGGSILAFTCAPDSWLTTDIHIKIYGQMTASGASTMQYSHRTEVGSSAANLGSGSSCRRVV